MNFPKITIITPSFNQGAFLEQTIQSVLDQQYPNLEYMVIDGGSRDASAGIIRKYEKHLAYWVSEKDAGQSDAINKGLVRATGHVVNWLNSDDYYAPRTLFTVAEHFADPRTRVVCGRSRLFRGADQTAYYSQGTDVYPGNLAKTIGWARMDQPETFFSAEAVRRMGPLDTRLHYLMDRDWWIRYLLLFGLEGIVQIPDVLVHFRLHESSKTVSQKPGFQVEHDTFYHALARQAGLQAHAALIAETCPVHPEFAPAGLVPDRSLAEKVLNYYLLFRAGEFYAASRWKEAKRFLAGVTASTLEKEDKKLHRQLYLRNTFLPEPVIHFLRKQ